MYVKIIETNGITVGGEELLKTPITADEANYTLPSMPSQYLPQDLFLEVGEKLVITTYNISSGKVVDVLHYSKQPKQESQSQAQSFVFSGEVTPK